jgi:phosphoserine phosphatase RsbU/P
MTTETVVVDVSQDWLSACDVQSRFMQIPTAANGALTYSARCRQMRALGGDCYDFLALTEDRLALAIADASGKGLPAALMAANVQSSLRTAAGFAGNDAVAVVRAVNSQVHSSSPADRFATLFYGVFDAATRTLRYVNAGHNPPLVIRDGRIVARLEADGPPAGVFSDSEYRERAIQLAPGDLLVAYTDGVTEALDPAGSEWGFDGLKNAAIECGSLPAAGAVDALFGALDEYSRGRQTDDATILTMRVR